MTLLKTKVNIIFKWISRKRRLQFHRAITLDGTKTNGSMPLVSVSTYTINAGSGGDLSQSNLPKRETIAIACWIALGAMLTNGRARRHLDEC